jgi:hypothetical protein
VYLQENESRQVGDLSRVYQAGYGYKHQPSTFVSTSNEIRSNEKVKLAAGGGPVDFNIFLGADDPDYYEIFSGYPRNHYTHKMQVFGPNRVIDYNGSIYVRNRQTIESTVGSDGLGDNSLPIESSNVSNVNVVNSDNVLS